MATLKQLVDETTKIKNELVTCHSNLKNNLTEKGVECSDADKMSSLIDKVNDIKTEKHNLPNWYPLGDFWIRANDIPNATNAPKCDIVDNYIYVMSKSHFQRYNVELNQWDILNQPSTLRDYGTLTACGNKLYFMGGSATSTSKSNDCYDIDSGSWQSVADMLAPRQFASSTCVQDDIYVIAGYNGNATVYLNECYNTKLNTWTTKSPHKNIGKSKWNFGCESVGDNIYCMGDWYGYNRCYNTKTDTWTTKTSMPISKLDYIDCALFDDNLYTVGGYYSTGSTAHCCYNTKLDVWTTKAQYPIQAYGVGLCAHNKNIYGICGGRSSNAYADTYCYLI